VVVQHVEVAVPIDGVRDDAFEVGGVGDVAAVEGRDRPRVGQLGLESTAAVFVDIGDDDRGAVRGQAPRRGRAHPGPGAPGDDRDLAVEATHVLSPVR
jgi:hypothetical protein